MSIRDLSLDDLLNLMPAAAREELVRTLHQEGAAVRTGTWQESLKAPQDRPSLARKMLHELVASDEHAEAALAICVRAAGVAFASTSDQNVKAIAWANALSAMSHYLLHHITSDTTVQSMTNQLIGDIENIVDGRSSAILKEGKSRRRPALPKQHEIIFAYSAAIIDVLVRVGRTEHAAADEVAKLLHSNGWPLPPSTLKSNASTSKRLLGRRAQMRSGKGSAFAHQMYNQATRDIAFMPTPDALRWLVAALELTGTKV